MSSEEWFQHIESINNLEIVEVEGGYTFDILLSEIKQGNYTNLVFKDREEIQKIKNQMVKSSSLEF